MAYPRFAAVAETGWTLAENKNTEDFLRRAEKLIPQLEAAGITPASPAQWNPNLWQRLVQTVKFYRGILTKDMIKGYD